MALHSNAEELKDYLFYNSDQLKNAMFVLAHAPFCAMKIVQDSPDKDIYTGLLKQIFEASPYFKTKDSKHIFKWNYQEGRYFNYVYDMIRRTKP